MKRKTVQWVLFAVSIVGALLGIVLLIALIGFFLPTRHVVSVTTVLAQPADSVWAVISDFASYPSWWEGAASVERLEDEQGRTVWLQRDRRNQALPIVVLESDPPRRLVTEIAADDLPFGGRWIYQIEPSPRGCTVKITERGEVYNPIFRFMSRFVLGHYTTLESYLSALARRFGEDPEVLRVSSP
jgi:hypothetical protein